MTTDELIKKILSLGTITNISTYWTGLTVSVGFYYPTLPLPEDNRALREHCNFSYTSRKFSLNEALEKCLAAMPLPGPNDFVNRAI